MKILKHLKRSILNYIEFEKQCKDLDYLLNYNASESSEINNLIMWYRNEYSKLPYQYPGDHVVVNKIRNKICEGNTLQTSIAEIRKEFQYKLNIAATYTQKFGY
jgi:hypothetical protein